MNGSSSTPSSSSSSSDTLTIKLEFGGGTELLLAPPRSKSHTIQLPKWIDPDHSQSTLSSDKNNKNRKRIPRPSVTAPVTSTGTGTGTSTTMTMTTTTTTPPIEAQEKNSKLKSPATMRSLIQHIRDEMIVERPELFIDSDGQGIRPGILVLINDSDWELEGELEYTLQEGDEVCFISTLHGG